MKGEKISSKKDNERINGHGNTANETVYCMGLEKGGGNQQITNQTK